MRFFCGADAADAEPEANGLFRAEEDDISYAVARTAPQRRVCVAGVRFCSGPLTDAARSICDPFLAFPFFFLPPFPLFSREDQGVVG